MADIGRQSSDNDGRPLPIIRSIMPIRSPIQRIMGTGMLLPNT
jgi:hypothetical protein